MEEHRMQKDQIIEELATGKMSRRQFNQKLIALGATMVTIPLGSKMANAGSDDHPTVFTWEGWEVPELHQPYIGKHGQSPNFAIFGDEEEAFAKMRAGFKVDLTQPCSYKVPIWKDAGILQPMDPSRLSNWSDIIPALKTIPGTFDGDKQYFIPTDWGLTSVLYRADLAPEYVGNETWGMLWDPKYKGRLSMADSLIDGVMVAAIYIGAKDPFNMTDAEKKNPCFTQRTAAIDALLLDQSCRHRTGISLRRIGRSICVEFILRGTQKRRFRRALYQSEGRRNDLGLWLLPND
jgi:spermidine/putrescine-binding protein